MEKGYIVNWEAEKEIWEHEFFDKNAALHCDPKETGLILTEASNSLPVLQGHCDQIIFEEFGFARYLRTTGMFIRLPRDTLLTFKDPPSMYIMTYNPISRRLLVRQI